MEAVGNLVLMCKIKNAGHACQARLESFLGGIVQVDIFIKHHLRAWGLQPGILADQALVTHTHTFLHASERNLAGSSLRTATRPGNAVW
eukprot:164644-Pelagomonas_calceolata.AAC.3